MAQAVNNELVERFEQFFRDYYHDAIGELARKFPTDQRSLHVDWSDLYRFDPDLADDYLSHPADFRSAAEEALRLYDLPVDVKLGGAHVRVRGLGETTDIRDIRASDVNTLIAVSGIVRKATDVRPKVREAAFECQRCGTFTRVSQGRGNYREPHECQGCERQGPFRLNVDQSEFVDAQQIRVQESPESLHGGETPRSIDVHLEDDVTGEVTPGDRVTATGVLRLDQDGGGDSPVFDTYMEGTTVEIDEEEFEDMNISEAEKKEIIRLSEDEEAIYDMVVDSIAPSIYGYDRQKLAIALQLFSGVTKHLPDGSRIRGDLHMLLIGDPGTGKCQKYDTKVALADGTERALGALVEEELDDPVPVDDGVYDEVDIPVQSLEDGEVTRKRATRVWKREAPEKMYRIRLQSGRELEVTPSHPLFTLGDCELAPTRAEELEEGEFLAAPRRLRPDHRNGLDVEIDPVEMANANSLDVPDALTPSLARLLGYVVAEGHVSGDRSSPTLAITNADEAVLRDAAAALDHLGLRHWTRPHHSGNGVEVLYCSSAELVRFLEEIEPAMLETSAQQRIPDPVMRSDSEVRTAFLRAYVEGEGHVSTTEREICVASMSERLLEETQSLLLSLGIGSQIHPRENGSYRLRISGRDFDRYVTEVGFVTERESLDAGGHEGTPTNSNTDVVPVGEELRRIRERLALSQHECGIPRPTYQHYERGDRNPTRSSLRAVLDTFERRVEELASLRSRVLEGGWEAIETARDELKMSQESLASGMTMSQTAVSYYERQPTVPDGGEVQSARQVVLDRIESGLSTTDAIRSLRRLVEGDIDWNRILSIETVEPDSDWVYDLEVEDTHTYISEGVVSHNSQLLQYVQEIAPRSVYTSGKGASSAGLTAAAVQDDFGDSQEWSLEAGALVLADQGVAAVDELDKMDAGDRSAMHQALEQQSVSISKAGINATLKSRCSLLGAANPKYGRFDEYEPIAEQIELDPALISRFDLIFTVTDKPDEEEDRRLARHILSTNHAGELSIQQAEMTSPDVDPDEVAEMTSEADPAIDPDLLRKYVAYAKQNCFPRMTEEAKTAIEEFYTDLRSEGTGSDSPIPITARKLEALVRLAEASARIRLSDEVTERDAHRVIDIVRSSIEDVGMDPESGELDADIVETGTSKTQRDRIQSIKAVIADIEDEYDEGAPVDVVMERAEEIGLDSKRAEDEIDKLCQKGELYRPNQDHVRTI